MKEVLANLLLGGVGAAIIGLIGQRMNWWNPKEKAGVRKVDSEIMKDAAEIQSKKIEDEIKVSQQALEWTAQFAAQLEKANRVIDTLHTIIEDMKRAEQKFHQDYTGKIDKIQAALDEQKEKCRELEIENDFLKSKYGL